MLALGLGLQHCCSHLGWPTDTVSQVPFGVLTLTQSPPEALLRWLQVCFRGNRSDLTFRYSGH